MYAASVYATPSVTQGFLIKAACQITRKLPPNCTLKVFTSLCGKSEDPLSPMYTPSLFSFTPSPKKIKAEQGLERYEAAKQGRGEKDRMETVDTLGELSDETDDIVYPHNTNTVSTQTELTLVDLSALQEDHQRRIAELVEMCVAKAYP